jgi:hypothetical protein
MNTIDEALEMLDGCGPEFRGGLSNHGPMAAEALVRLGREREVIPWVSEYRLRLIERPHSRYPIDSLDWRGALGDGSRVADWTEYFRSEFDDAPWPSVVATWTPRLAPGLIAAATHGIIRTAHAVRSLEDGETEPRLRELADGLAYWAARYVELPSRPSESKKRTPSQALTYLREIPADQQFRDGLISQRLGPLADDETFLGAADMVDPSGDAEAFISDLTEAFAGVYLRKTTDALQTITFIHAVTGPSAVRILLPYVPPEARRDLLRYAWQAAAGLYTACGHERDVVVSETTREREDLIDMAVSTEDEHAIKFTEACLREHALNPAPIYLHAAEHASGVLRGAR